MVYHGNDGEIRGRENVKAYLQGYLTALPDLKLAVAKSPAHMCSHAKDKAEAGGAVG